MATRTSQLIVELLDRVSAPARKAANGLLGIPKAVNRANGQIASFSDRVTVAIDRNNAAIDRARGRMLDAVAGFYAVSHAIGAPVRKAMAYETALTNIGTKAGLSVVELKKIGNEAQRIGSKVNQFAPDILRSVDYLVGMGLSADQAMGAVEAIGMAATATGADIGDLSQAGYAAMANLKVEAKDVGLALDFMAKAGKAGGFELKDMAQYMPALGSSYSVLGQTGTEAVADLAAALQIVRKDTGDASTAATNLNNVLQKMVSPITEKKFKEMGVDLRKELALAAEQGLNPFEAIAAITHKALKGDLSKIGYLFEDAQAQAGVRSLIQHMGDYQKIRDEALTGGGENAKDFATVMQTSAEQMKKASIAMDNLSTTLGDTLLPIMKAVNEQIVPFLEAIRLWASENPKLVGTIIAVTASVVGLRIAMSALSYLAFMGKGGILGALSVGASMLGATVGRLWGAARASIALQAALGAMEGAKLGVLGRIAAGARGMLFAVPGVSAIASGISAIGAAIATISAPVWGVFAVVAAAVAAAGVMIYKYWDRITSVLSGVGQAVGEILAPALEKIRPLLDWFAPLGDAIAAGWEKAKAAVSAVSDWLGTIFQKETLSEEDKAAYEKAGYDAIMALWDGMKKVMADLMAWIEQKVSGLLSPFQGMSNRIASYFNMGNLGGEGVSGNPMGDIAGENANGGPMTAGRTYLVGEKGPELVTPSKGGYVHPNGTRFGGGGGGTFNMGGVTIHAAPGMDARQIADEVVRRVEQMAASAFRGVQADVGMEAY